MTRPLTKGGTPLTKVGTPLTKGDTPLTARLTSLVRSKDWTQQLLASKSVIRSHLHGARTLYEQKNGAKGAGSFSTQQNPASGTYSTSALGGHTT